jgi:hypothetical protein
VTVASAVKTRLDDRLTQARWRLRNRARSRPADAPAELQDVVERLRRDGVVITDFATVFGETALFDEAAAEVRRRYESRPPEDADTTSGSKATFLTKLGDPSYSLDHVFARARRRERIPEAPVNAARARRLAHPPDAGSCDPDPALAPRR